MATNTDIGQADDEDVLAWVSAARDNLRYALEDRLDMRSTAAAAIKLLDRALLALPPGDN